MSSPFFNLYVSSIIQLTRTLVIKSEATANLINKRLELFDVPVYEDPRTWKYYLNLNGELHSTNVPMTIRSMDTLETIEFNKDSLAIHRTTADNYQIGNRYYNDLLKRYPEQEALINGIINPTDIDEAIAAPDHEILNYDKSLVEANEENLITNLKLWVKRFLVRWDVTDYSLSDDLYQPAMLGVMYSNIPMAIINIRLNNCKTHYVHSFHIKQYLASHGRLDKFLPYLTMKQQLFLYRNIKYIQRNAGKQTTFDTLLARMMTDRGLPLVSYDMRHRLDGMPDSFKPEIELDVNWLNFQQAADKTDTASVELILQKELSIADGNRDELDDATVYVNDSMKTSEVDSLPTKVLESVVTDISSSVVYSFELLVIQHWLYMASTGRYSAIVTVTNPSDGEPIILTSKEAFILFLYTYNKSFGVDLPIVPNIIAAGIKSPVLPTFEYLRSISDSAVLSDETIHALLADNPPMPEIISVPTFFEYMIELRTLLNKHVAIYGSEKHFEGRGQAEGLANRFWISPEINLASEQDYDVWLDSRGLDLSSLTNLELDILAQELLEKGTGFGTEETLSVREIQTAMVELMSSLSSYSVQFLKSIVSERYLKAEWGAIRLGDVDAEGTTKLPLLFEPVDVLDVHAKGRAFFDYGTAFNDNPDFLKFDYYNTETQDISLDTSVVETITVKFRYAISGIHITDILEEANDRIPATTGNPPKSTLFLHPNSAGVSDVIFTPN